MSKLTIVVLKSGKVLKVDNGITTKFGGLRCCFMEEIPKPSPNAETIKGNYNHSGWWLIPDDDILFSTFFEDDYDY